jgi:carbamoyltransferase
MADPRAVLGISAFYHDSAAALSMDGELVAAAHEERFTRRKGDAEFPIHAVEYVLAASDLEPADLTAVAFYESPFLKLDRLLGTYLTGNVRAARAFVTAMRSWLPSKLWVERRIRQELDVKLDILFGDHHLSHAASAFYPSPFEEAATLTVDGVGEWSTTSIGHGTPAGIDLLEHIEYPDSLGLLYSAFTLYCGFRINSGEYKLMGLAPYGEPRFADAIESEVVHLAEDGSFSLNPAHFGYLHGLRTFTPALEDLLGRPARPPESLLTQHYADVAASIQVVTNRAVLGLAERARAATGSARLCLAGGVALNVVAMGLLERQGTFEDIWIQPASGDAGGAVGAALWASHDVLGCSRVVRPSDAMQGAFLGPAPSDGGEGSAAALERAGLRGHRMDDEELAVAAARMLAGGEVVGVARGRMEFGPRALGNRSILADARDPEMQRRLNLKTKFREGFRPFAPIVLADRAAQYFETDGRSSPYMLKTYAVREDLRIEPEEGPARADQPLGFDRINEVRSRLPAITHLDYSARVQTVDPERHPFLARLLQEFEELTGCAVLVNTSFNVRGEPIVCTAADAINCFRLTDIDGLVLDDQLVRRDEHPDFAIAQEDLDSALGVHQLD